MFVDTHVHLNREEFAGEGAAVVERAVAAGVTRFLNVGYDIPSSIRSVELARGDVRIQAAVGIHPHDALQVADAEGRITDSGRAALAELAALAADPEVAAIGEIGLDYFRDLSPRPAQHAALAAQLDLARKLDLPVVLHIRDAYADTVAALETAGLPPRRGIMHAFAGDSAVAAWAVENDFLLGIGGPVTYKNSRLPEVLADLRPENLVLETDAPWLPPVPHRGKRNESAYLVRTAAKVAGIFGVELTELAAVTSANYDRLRRAGGR